MKVIWVKYEAEYFLKRDWTGQIRLIRFKKSGFSRIVEPCATTQPKNGRKQHHIRTPDFKPPR
jgi:hypothetical protein